MSPVIYHIDLVCRHLVFFNQVFFGKGRNGGNAGRFCSKPGHIMFIMHQMRPLDKFGIVLKSQVMDNKTGRHLGAQTTVVVRGEIEVYLVFFQCMGNAPLAPYIK
ncbi:hypothetical protein D3C72_1598750 [compost metagenome]